MVKIKRIIKMILLEGPMVGFAFSGLVMLDPFGMFTFTGWMLTLFVWMVIVGLHDYGVYSRIVTE